MNAMTLQSQDAVQSLAIDKATRFVTRHMSTIVLLTSVVLVALMLFLPEMAYAQDAGAKLRTGATNAINWIKIAVYFILVVAVLGCAVMAGFGQMSWKTVGMVLVGSIIAGLAAEVVTGLSGLS